MVSEGEILFRAMARVRGRPVTITRGNDVLAECVTAYPSKPRLAMDAAQGAGRIEAESLDWNVRASDYGDPMPLEGDRLSVDRGGQTETYELVTPPYEPIDADRVILRLHTRLIAAQ